HGSRSIKAIIEMAAAAAVSRRKLDLGDLPPDHVLGVHRDLGPLDPLSIGGLIGLSAGALSKRARERSVRKRTRVHAGSWRTVAVELAFSLWKIGAVIGYGGGWDETRLTVDLLGQLRTRSRSLVEAASRLTPAPDPKPEIRVEVFAREQPKRKVRQADGM